MDAMIVCALVGAILSVGICNTAVAGGNVTTQAIAVQLIEPNVNATISRVIHAMVVDGVQNDTAIPMPEHHYDRAQRIVARKGVINDVATPVVRVEQGGERPVNATKMGGTSSKGLLVVENNKSNSSTVATPTKEKDGASMQHYASISDFKKSTIGKNVSSTTIVSTVHKALPPSHAQSKPSTESNATITQQISTAVRTKTTNTTTTITTTTTTTTTPTTTTMTTTTTTTTPATPSATTSKANARKKPKITYSIKDEPKLLQAAKPGYVAPYDPMDSTGKLRVEEPRAQFSKEYLQGGFEDSEQLNGRREYIIPVVTLIFAIPLLLGLFLLSYRRAKEFWLTRHYRRMDFLIDGMYNY